MLEDGSKSNCREQSRLPNLQDADRQGNHILTASRIDFPPKHLRKTNCLFLFLFEANDWKKEWEKSSSFRFVCRTKSICFPIPEKVEQVLHLEKNTPTPGSRNSVRFLFREKCIEYAFLKIMISEKMCFVNE